MNENDCEYGLVSCKKTGWIDRQGRKLYEGKFRTVGDQHGYSVAVVLFWAKHHVKATREIARRLSNGEKIRQTLIFDEQEEKG